MTSDRAAARDDDLHPWCSSASISSTRSKPSLAIIRIRKSPACRVDDGVGMKPPPPREIPATRMPSTSSETRASPRMRRDRHAEPQEVAAAERLADLLAVVEQHQLDRFTPQRVVATVGMFSRS